MSISGNPGRVAEVLALKPGSTTIDYMFARDSSGVYYRGLGDLHVSGRVREFNPRVSRVNVCGGCDCEALCASGRKGFDCGKNVGHGGRYKRINPIIYADGLTTIDLGAPA